jgi:hypothetical protein
MGTLHAATNSFLRPIKTRSLEVVSNLALWSTSIVNIELNKSEHGLGFSVLDYLDPSNPSYSPVIVIRALVPGGVAQLDGRVLPGDRLVAVNDIILENMTLNDVIKILKSTPKGPVKLSLSKPLPYPKFKNENDDKSDQDINNNNNQRVSRISKSKTTAEINNNHKVNLDSFKCLLNIISYLTDICIIIELNHIFSACFFIIEFSLYPCVLAENNIVIKILLLFEIFIPSSRRNQQMKILFYKNSIGDIIKRYLFQMIFIFTIHLLYI